MNRPELHSREYLERELATLRKRYAVALRLIALAENALAMEYGHPRDATPEWADEEITDVMARTGKLQ